MGATIAAVIAASSARVAEDLLERFRVSGATAPDRAQSLSQLGLTPDAAMLAQYAQAGVICQTRGDRFYLDESAYAVYRRRGTRTAMIIAIAAGLMAVGMAVAAAVMTSRR